MTTTRGSLAAAVIAAGLAGGACGPLRLDSRPEIRGTVAAVQASSVDIRHKTGQIYRVELTRETRIIHNQRPGDLTLCPGQRATVLLIGHAQFTASSMTIWSGRCRERRGEADRCRRPWPHDAAAEKAIRSRPAGWRTAPRGISRGGAISQRPSSLVTPEHAAQLAISLRCRGTFLAFDSSAVFEVPHGP